MAFDQVDASAVYLCTGNPKPEDIETLVTWLLNDSIQSAFTSKKGRRRVMRACPTLLPAGHLLFATLSRCMPARQPAPSSTNGAQHTTSSHNILTYPEIKDLQQSNGLALTDIVKELHV